MAEHLDPVKYEIFRHRLFSILEEGRTTIAMVSGSPPIVEGGECMLSIYDSAGNLILCAGGILFHVTGSRDAILKTIEWYMEDPGVFEGDQFFYNDPYIAGSHIYDMIMVKPVFYQGQLIAWSGSMTHTSDTGGLLRGLSKEIFHEGIRYQGVKLVERGKLRADVFRCITQQCRDPHYVGLDLKARIASNNVAERGYLTLVDKFGADFVMAASQRLIREGDELARAKLKNLPDGTWRSRMYRCTTVSVDGQEQVRPYKVACTMTKKGDQLTFDATGSSPQNEDHRNATYVCTWSKIFEALAGFAFWDLPWNQGMTDRVKLIAPEGTIVNCKHPASCGLGTMAGGYLTGAAMDCIARMMYAGGHREDVNASWKGNFGEGGPFFWYGGHSQYGGVVGQGIYDMFAGGQGATPYRDGNHTGGVSENPQSCISDVEFTEMYFPFLYLSRRQLTDSGAFGKFAGGMGPECLMMVYGTQDLTVDYMPTPISSQVTGAGLFGGYPLGNILAANLLVRINNLRGHLQEGHYPTTLEEALAWGQDASKVPGFQVQRQLGGIRVGADEHDILCYQIFTGCGYGDPLERDLQLVAADLQNLVVSQETAASFYGVVFQEGTGRIDPEATQKRRQEMRQERLKRAVPLGPGVVPGQVRKEGDAQRELLRIHEYLGIVETAAGRKVIACVKCGHQFCEARENYKVHALRWSRDVAEMKKVPPGEETYAYYQEYVCPGCATLLQVDIWYPSLDSEEPLWDIQIDEEGLGRAGPA